MDSQPLDAAFFDSNAEQAWKQTLAKLIAGNDLTVDEASSVLRHILDGQAEPTRVAGLLVGLQVKGVSVAEITGLASAMRAVSPPISLPEGTIDIVGTGGSKHGRAFALNVSTMASFVAVAAGAVVCKHGNKKASSTSGSFDFLEALGLAIELDSAQVLECVETQGLGFVYAKKFHPAMRHVGLVRKQLGVPTVFNMLGPLCHPGNPKRQLIGTPSIAMAEKMAEALVVEETELSWVVSGADGFDELTLSGESTVFEVSKGSVARHSITPNEVGLAEAAWEDFAGGSAQENVQLFKAVSQGKKGPHRDVVVLNAAAGLVVAGVVDTVVAGVALAQKALDDGSVMQLVERMRTQTHKNL